MDGLENVMIFELPEQQTNQNKYSDIDNDADDEQSDKLRVRDDKSCIRII